ncbi:MAG: hypothetical protein Phog2KO_50640 [Phototrophicaceae bacterium]
MGVPLDSALQREGIDKKEIERRGKKIKMLEVMFQGSIYKDVK